MLFPHSLSSRLYLCQFLLEITISRYVSVRVSYRSSPYVSVGCPLPPQMQHACDGTAFSPHTDSLWDALPTVRGIIISTVTQAQLHTYSEAGSHPGFLILSVSSYPASYKIVSSFFVMCVIFAPCIPSYWCPPHACPNCPLVALTSTRGLLNKCPYFHLYPLNFTLIF